MSSSTRQPNPPSPAAPWPWPRWSGADLAPQRALLVLAGADPSSSLACADACATLAGRGIRVLLRLPSSQADWLSRVWGVWAVWPMAPGDDPDALPDPAGAPPDLIDAVDAWIPLADLPSMLQPPAEGPWPRLHLGAVLVTSLFAEADAQGQPDRADALWIGSCLDDGPSGAPAMDLLDGLAGPLQICTWHWRDPVVDLDAPARARRLGRWPDLGAPDTDRLLLARRMATLDLLLTDQPEAATLAWSLGKPVWWLPGDAAKAPPAALGPLPQVSVQDLPGALAAWAPSRRHALRKLAPDDALAGVVEAITACQQGALDAARAHAIQLLISHPQRPDAWRLLGLIGQTTGMPAWAARCHARVTALAPAWPDGWKSLGLLQLELGQPDAALDSLERALALAPQDAAVRGPLAHLHEHRDGVERAITLYRDGLGHQPGDTAWQLALAALLIRIGEPEGALSYLDACARQLPEDDAGHQRALRLSAQAHADRGDTDAAAACLRRCLEHHADDARAAADLAALYRKRGQIPRAREVLLQSLAAAEARAGDAGEAATTWTDADRARRDLEAWMLLRLSDPARAPDDDCATACATLLAGAGPDACPDTALWCALGPLLDGPTLAGLRPSVRPVVMPTPERRALGSRRPRLAYVGSPAALARHQDRLRSLLARHDRSRLEVLIWHWSAPQDDGRVETPAGLDAEDLGAGSDAELARQILSLEPDALVDLDGDAWQARPGLWSRLPAGLRRAVFDRWKDPEMAASADVPGSAWPLALACAGPPDALQAGSALRPRWRERLDLPALAPVLACLAPLEAMSTADLDRLFALLRACAPAHLWLAPVDTAAREGLATRARAAGIEPSRLHAVEPARHAHALRHGGLMAADLYLQLAPDWHDGVLPDPLAQALAAAVPVLARGGRADPSGRVAALMRAADALEGLHEDVETWQQAALGLLRQPRELLGARQKGITRHRSAALFQAAAVVARLEASLLARPPGTAGSRAHELRRPHAETT
ncbi:tetratricopeptide repeat protein [Leptothrix discophora]|uniref:Tetratricopeptide repeat protein n=1 Tax=Leptothrix discophora TaxID=89 RepID=A0ABT9FZN4_LEPDI|nr:tetratricopeptide repeat protein [Leptothrix discophora]MDP4299690.1 hypothetical protein [Leptothrix discophora]